MSDFHGLGNTGNGSLDYLLSTFGDLLGKGDVPLCDCDEHMRLVELYFLAKNIRELTDIQLYQNLSKASTLTNGADSAGSIMGGSNNADVPERKMTYMDRSQLVEQINACDQFLQKLDSYIAHRVNLAEQTGLRIPRILRLCRKYGFVKHEQDVFLLMTVMQGSKNNSVLNSLVEEDYYRKVTGFQRLANMCEVDIDVFCDGERQHMKEGIVLVDEDNGAQLNLRIQRVAVQLMYDRQVRPDDLLKISQTSLEEILQQEGGLFEKGMPLLSRQNSLGSAVSATSGTSASAAGQLAPSAGGKRKRGTGFAEGVNLADLPEEARQQVLARLNSAGIKVSSGADLESLMQRLNESHEEDEDGSEGSMDDDEDDREGESQPQSSQQEAEPISNANSNGADSSPAAKMRRTTETTSATDATGFPASPGIAFPRSVALASSPTGTSSALKPYPAGSQLEFLEDCLQIIALMIKGNVARLKDDMKKEGAASRYNSYDGGGELKHSRRELTAKLRVQENKVQMRVRKTAEQGVALPRLEVMNQRFHLDPFEKKLILLLIGKTVSPVVKALMETLDTNSRIAEDVLTVGQALSILCPDFHSQIAHRRYFYQSGRLLMNAIISLAKPKWHVGTGDLTENRITLDRRILDWVVGLDSEINELVEGSDLYEPVVELSQVVLPKGYAESILSQCSSYDYFQTYRQQVGLKKSISYGNSLVILLCGKSGTGKTMTVNAIAHELGKKVLLVDFNGLMNKKDGSNSGDLEVDLKGLFRESKMSNTVLFFDECEVIFKSRNMGSERLLNALLTEIERHEGIVFMATNRPYEIDEAMHRRINMVLEYTPPDYAMRVRIWDNLLGPERVPADQIARVAAEDGAGKALGQDSGDKGEHSSSGSDKRNKVTLDPADVKLAGVFPEIPLSAPDVQSAVSKGIPLAEDVNISELAMRYELTGGFIKNAVLSAVLTALSRSTAAPLVSQADLVAGCKMQMRGNLTQRSFEDRVPLGRRLKDLFLTPEHRKQVEKILRHEAARAKVFGEWSKTAENGSPDGAAVEVKSSTFHCEQRATINLLAGTRGSGKSTLAEAIAQELGGRRLKYIHSSDFVGLSVAEIIAVFKTLVHDARIMDAMIVVDGFEHILDDGSEGGGGAHSKLQIMLSRVMDILHAFHGCVCLLCHIENPQNMMLQREFATRLFTFLRFPIPGHEIRTSLWQALLPPGALPPVKATSAATTATAGKSGGEAGAGAGANTGAGAGTAASAGATKKADKLHFEQLGRRFELNAGSIRSAVVSAVSEAAMRPGDDKYVKQADLLLAGEQELEKLKGGNFDLTSKMFT